MSVLPLCFAQIPVFLLDPVPYSNVCIHHCCLALFMATNLFVINSVFILRYPLVILTGLSSPQTFPARQSGWGFFQDDLPKVCFKMLPVYTKAVFHDSFILIPASWLTWGFVCATVERFSRSTYHSFSSINILQTFPVDLMRGGIWAGLSLYMPNHRWFPALTKANHDIFFHMLAVQSVPPIHSSSHVLHFRGTPWALSCNHKWYP